MIRRSRSPVDQIQDELRKAFLSGTTPSIQGSTGSGKSTRVVEFLLTVLEQFEQSESCFIAVTCPSRITAMALTKEAKADAARQGRPDIADYWFKRQTIFSTLQGHKLVFCVEDSLLNRYRWRDRFAQKCKLIVSDEVDKRAAQCRCLLPYLIKANARLDSVCLHERHDR